MNSCNREKKTHRVNIVQCISDTSIMLTCLLGQGVFLHFGSILVWPETWVGKTIYIDFGNLCYILSDKHEQDKIIPKKLRALGIKEPKMNINWQIFVHSFLTLACSGLLLVYPAFYTGIWTLKYLMYLVGSQKSGLFDFNLTICW